MDGNGRWAKQRGLERVQGHMEGVKSVRAVTEKCVELGVKYLSLYAFSEENWNRPTSCSRRWFVSTIPWQVISRIRTLAYGFKDVLKKPPRRCVLIMRRREYPMRISCNGMWNGS